MLKRALFLLLLSVLPLKLEASILPGFALEPVAKVPGFLTSIAFDPADRLYFSTTDGTIYRVDAGQPVRITQVPTASEGNAVNLGIAVSSSDLIVVHYVLPDLTAEVIGEVNVTTGAQREIVRLICDGGRPCSSEHHGGNPIIAPDGSIFVGLGDMGFGPRAQNPQSIAGKIFRITPDGAAHVWASGVRNPYDLAWDPAGYLIVSENGPVGDDEINIVHEGDNLGWPYTYGTNPPVEGMVPPVYTFPQTTAPTGLARVRSVGYLTDGGVLVGGFVPKALYYFPSVTSQPVLPPVAIFAGEVGAIIDVAQNGKGEVYVGSGGGIYRLRFPNRGDADGNGTIDENDLDALAREILDGDGNSTPTVQMGTFTASWGADVNGDGLVDARDVVALAKKITPKPRALTK